jgi:hypothetical protein
LIKKEAKHQIEGATAAKTPTHACTAAVMAIADQTTLARRPLMQMSSSHVLVPEPISPTTATLAPKRARNEETMQPSVASPATLQLSEASPATTRAFYVKDKALDPEKGAL